MTSKSDIDKLQRVLLITSLVIVMLVYDFVSPIALDEFQNRYRSDDALFYITVGAVIGVTIAQLNRKGVGVQRRWNALKASV